MDFLCEYGAVIHLGENRLTLRRPILMPEGPTVKAAAVRTLADYVNLPSLSSILMPAKYDESSCVEVLLEESLQLLLERGIRVAKGVTTVLQRF